MKKWRVYPANAAGMCLRGFCPTICKTEEDAQEQAQWLAAAMEKYGYKYECLIVEQCIA